MPKKLQRIGFKDLPALGVKFRYKPVETQSIPSGTGWNIFSGGSPLGYGEKNIKKANEIFLTYCEKNAIREIVRGDVENNVEIVDGIREFEVHGNIQKKVTLDVEIGSFKVGGNVGSESLLETGYGSVEIKGDLKEHSRIKVSLSGNITVEGNVGNHVSLTAKNGDISIGGSMGTVYYIDTSGIVFFKQKPKHIPRFSQIPKQVIVNGQDCTDKFFPPVFKAHNGSASRSKPSTSQEAGTSSSFQGNRPPPVNPEASAPRASEIDIEPAMQEYLGSFSAQQEPFVDAFCRLKLDTPEDFLCPISHDIPNHPVRVEGMLFDYNSLLALPAKEDGTRNNPLTCRPFQLNQIQPARDVKQRIETIISNAVLAESARPNAPTPSAPPMPMEKQKSDVTHKPLKDARLFRVNRPPPFNPEASKFKADACCSKTCAVM